MAPKATPRLSFLRTSLRTSLRTALHTALHTVPLSALALALLLSAALGAGPSAAEAQEIPGAGSPADAAATGDGAEGTAAGSDEPPPPPPRRWATPRATMMSFLEGFYLEDGEDGVDQAVAALDLSELPVTVRSTKGPELAYQLKEVLDRIALVDPEEIPVEPAGDTWTFAEREEGAITLARQPGGAWRFSAETVAAIPDLYESLRGEEVVEGVEQRASRTIAPGLWLRSQMPTRLLRPVLGLELWQWLGLLILIAVGFVVDRLVTWVAGLLVMRWLRHRLDEVPDGKLAKTLRPLGLLALGVVWALGLRFLALPVGALQILELAVRFVLAVAAVWTAYRLVDVLAAYLDDRARRTDNRFDDQLVPLVRKSLKVFVAAFGLVFIAESMELEISSLLAGIGLGGLAIALAAQDAVRNIFGSLMVLTDRPFSVGDWVETQGVEGTVEEVGFRSTRIRTFYDSLVTVPNANLIDAVVDNYGLRAYRRWSTRVTLPYDTPPERIEAFCEGVRELIRSHPDTRKDTFHVYLNAFGESAVEVMLYLFFETPDWTAELAARHRLALDILRLADQLEVEFAFPTRTLWLQRALQEDQAEAELPENALETGRRAARSLIDA